MKTLWFRRKRYGWGWTPVTWQGWVVTLGYIVILTALALSVERSTDPKEALLVFFIPFLILTTLLIRICYKTGEHPRWQWGKKDENNELQ